MDREQVLYMINNHESLLSEVQKSFDKSKSEKDFDAYSYQEYMRQKRRLLQVKSSMRRLTQQLQILDS